MGARAFARGEHRFFANVGNSMPARPVLSWKNSRYEARLRLNWTVLRVLQASKSCRSAEGWSRLTVKSRSAGASSGMTA